MEESETEQFVPSVPLTWQAIGAILFAGASGALEELAGTLEGISTALAADHNYHQDRRDMHEQAAQEIEALVRGAGE